MIHSFNRYTLLSLICVLTFSIHAQQVQIGADIDGDNAQDNAGLSVALSDDATIVAMSAHNGSLNGSGSGYVNVYELNAGLWQQRAATLIGSAQSNQFGSELDMSADGEIIAIGSAGDDTSGFDAGKVEVFQYAGSVYTPMGPTLFGDATAAYGLSVDLSDDGLTLAIAGPNGDLNGNQSGYVELYRWNGSDWVQLGNTLLGLQGLDRFGYAMALSGDGNRIAISRQYSIGNPDTAGEVRMYEYDGTDWVPFGGVLSGSEDGESYGFAVAVNQDGTVLSISAPYNDLNNTVFDGGRVLTYEHDGTNWTLKGASIVGTENNHRFGTKLSLSDDGNRLAISSQFFSGAGAQSGQVRIYDFENDAWNVQLPYLNGEAADDFSNAIAMDGSGNHILIGATGNDANGPEAGHSRVYNIENLLSSIDRSTTTALLAPTLVKDYVHIKGTTLIGTAQVFNATGQLYTNTFTSNEASLNLEALTTGMYLITLTSADTQSSYQIIKE